MTGTVMFDVHGHGASSSLPARSLLAPLYAARGLARPYHCRREAPYLRLVERRPEGIVVGHHDICGEARMKITFMGAGSTVFAKNVLGDCMCADPLRDAEIALYDVGAERLAESKRMLDNLNKNINDGRARISAYHGTENRKDALRSAKYVVNGNYSATGAAGMKGFPSKAS
jgi:hypothetical protein